MNGPKIRPAVIQLLPADGWRAVLADSEGKPWSDPLVCWALVQVPDKEFGPRVDEVYWSAVRGGHQAVVGMTSGLDGYVDSAEGCGNFLGYAPAGESLECWEEKAQEYVRRQRGTKP